ncbi:DUF2326 domain-containing protein [Rhizobium leguminosarum]|uniref:DUF2326 domain-containing protein n=1 Tax=Rhizobium leguminosarum TaxID=384 RepID=UPI001C987EC1|nr:DUF2326 domain-containing protein [Rhizobium leguminosarum]MBY5608553.1 DUF2326 domain-containing protein [Rhizobium leguminosarum]MBY5659420.1 DUF2326 domain-containing protein [Rhizobium leguminosarum]MBY5668953.1 DUF2326 domain-containing protein [Rhizobium leguminosarum]MBY5682855.1 DUF2326 domain-containing protein [Rhizobium leguminosarum]
MITDIYSDLKSFRALAFKSGLNILLAERHETSGARDTRNGTGKTSMIELLHFLVQDRKNPDDDFHKDVLVGRTFGAKFREEGHSFSIERKANVGKARDEAFLDGVAIEFKDLRSKLALRWFGLGDEESAGTFAPKFGALFAYFVRKARNGAFNSPILNSSDQNAWDSQINVAYLLGFDWKLVQKLQLLKEQKKKADNLVGMIREGYFSNSALDLNKMQSRLDILEVEVARKRREIASSEVVDGYREHEKAANNLAGDIRELNEANLRDLDLVENINLALQEVEDANLADLRTMYEQVGLYFPDQVKRRFNEVAEFHRKLAENRHTQLSDEKRRAEQRIKERRAEIDRLQKGLKEKLALLRSGVAIDRLTRLQSELHAFESEMADLNQQIPRLRDVVEEQARLKRQISEQVELIGHDVREREDARKFAVQAFAEVSRWLYDAPGNLILGRSKGVGGLEIDTDIVGKKSGGKSHMQVFCFDWVLLQAARRQDRSPGFLVHDSHIFDGVDGRQIGLALSFAHEKAKELGVQYIVAMNSNDLDKIKHEEAEGTAPIFDPTPFIVPTRLTDDNEGGLFGIRF